MAEKKKSYLIRIDEGMKKMIEQTKEEIAKGWKIDPHIIETPAITPTITEWAMIGKEISMAKKKQKIKKDKVGEFMDKLVGLK